MCTVFRYKELPESGSTSCFFCIFLSNMNLGSLYLSSPLWSPTHTRKLAVVIFNKTSLSILSPLLSNWTTANNPPQSLSHSEPLQDCSPTLRSVCVCIPYASSHPSSQAPETVVSLNDTLPLSPFGLCAAEQTSLSLSDPNQTVVYCWTTQH